MFEQEEIQHLLDERKKLTYLKSHLLDVLPIGYAISDLKTNKFIKVNDLLAYWCDYESPFDMVGVNFYDLLIKEEHEKIHNIVDQNLDAEKKEDVHQDVCTTYITPLNNYVVLRWFNFIEAHKYAISGCFLISKYKV